MKIVDERGRDKKGQRKWQIKKSMKMLMKKGIEKVG
jgi:hypothetical protein